MAKAEFKKELEQLINRHSMEGRSNTPDFLLATYLMNCLETYEDAVYQRETFHANNRAMFDRTPLAVDANQEGEAK